MSDAFLETAFTGKTLLIVEDDSTLREALVYEFESQGATVFSAENGTIAFDIISKHTIDGVISDIRMPGGDGIQLIKHVKNMNYSTPVLMFITGFSDLDIADAYNLGAEAVLKKPFDLDNLVNTVKKMILPKKISGLKILTAVIFH